MVFKPRALNGLLLYKGHRMNGGGDFVSINLIDGYVEFRFDPGNGPAVIKSLEPVKLNRWHKLTASRTSRLGTLLVDDQPEVGGYALGAFNQLSLPLNLFVGGVSDIQYVSRDSGLTSSFQGCIETIAINGRSIMLAEEALFIENVTECHHSP
ncbi:Pikachurin [Halotydeus destructor]|nr:Pikachurin [Halotydeus destructor]